MPFAVGSGTDIIARVIAEELQRGLGTNIVVDNKPGASGQIAADIVAKAAPDGYTLMMATNTSHSANPSLFRKLSYDPSEGVFMVHVPCTAPSPALTDLMSDPLQLAMPGVPAAVPFVRDGRLRAQGHVPGDRLEAGRRGRRVVGDPPVRERLLSMGYTPMGGTPEDFTRYMRAEIVKWGEAVKFSGAKVD